MSENRKIQRVVRSCAADDSNGDGCSTHSECKALVLFAVVALVFFVFDGTDVALFVCIDSTMIESLGESLQH